MPSSRTPNSAPNKWKKPVVADITELDEADKLLREHTEHLSELYSSPCFPLLIPDSINPFTVDNVYGQLQDDGHKPGAKCLTVVLDSGGGDINAAYNLALLFRRYAAQLHFVVPRWAKSAATVLVCGGDELSMTPVAELGPVDPQITAFNPLEGRLEQFSPLHIESTLELIRSEFASGNVKLADGLLQRLQFPLTLGSFKTSLDIGKVYIERLLSSRMMKDREVGEVTEVAKRFVEGYSDHGFVIGCDELRELGFNVNELDGPKLDVVWSIHLLNRKREEIKQQKEREKMDERIRQLPPELLDLVPGAAAPASNGGQTS